MSRFKLLPMLSAPELRRSCCCCHGILNDGSRAEPSVNSPGAGIREVGVSEVDPRLFRHLRTDVQAERADILRRQTETQSRFAHPNKATVLALLKSSEGGLKNAAIEERRVSHVARMQT